MTSERPKRLRRVQLAVPGSSEKMLAKAAASAADHVFLDLEDAVADLDGFGMRHQGSPAHAQTVAACLQQGAPCHAPHPRRLVGVPPCMGRSQIPRGRWRTRAQLRDQGSLVRRIRLHHAAAMHRRHDAGVAHATPSPGKRETSLLGQTACQDWSDLQ